MKKRWLIFFLWMLVLAVAGMIFLFSAQDGDLSSATSRGVTDFLIRLLQPSYDSLSRREQVQIYNWFSYYVRKAAHFSEFALLGVSLRLLLWALQTPLPIPLAWLAGTLYACTDEWHQRFVSSRSPVATDVLIDSAGVLTGVLAVSLILWLCGRKRARRQAGPAR